MPGNYGPDESEQDLPTSLPGSTNTNKQACKQISKQASKQTNKQANKHTFFDEQTKSQASKHARMYASKQASKQAYYMLYIDMPACMHVTACVGVLISKHKYTVVSVCLCVRGLRAVLPMIKKMSKCTDR